MLQFMGHKESDMTEQLTFSFIFDFRLSSYFISSEESFLGIILYSNVFHCFLSVFIKIARPYNHVHVGSCKIWFKGGKKKTLESDLYFKL